MTGFAVVEHEQLDTALLYVVLYLFCAEGCEGEVGVFAVDVEQCFVVHILKVVEYKSAFSGTPDTVEIDMVLVGKLKLSIGIGSVLRHTALEIIKPFHSNPSFLKGNKFQYCSDYGLKSIV